MKTTVLCQLMNRFLCVCRWRTWQTQPSLCSIRPKRIRSVLAGPGWRWLLLRGGAAGRYSTENTHTHTDSCLVVGCRCKLWSVSSIRSYKSVDGRTTPLLCGTNPPTPQPASPDPGHCPMLHDYSHVPSPMSPASPDTTSNPHTPCSRDSHRLLSSEDTRCSTPDFTFEERVRAVINCGPGAVWKSGKVGLFSTLVMCLNLNIFNINWCFINTIKWYLCCWVCWHLVLKLTRQLVKLKSVIPVDNLWVLRVFWLRWLNFAPKIYEPCCLLARII